MESTSMTELHDNARVVCSTASVRHALTGETMSSVAGGQIIESWMDWDSTVALQVLDDLQPGNDKTS
jgi:hypothetical protein